jgi:hypothetical protein
MDSAVSVLNLPCHIGPLMRDQLRYSSGFLIITISSCSTFILETIQKFPSLFPNPKKELSLLFHIAALLSDLGADKSHGACITGQSIMRQVDAIFERINDKQFCPLSPINSSSDASATTKDIEVIVPPVIADGIDTGMCPFEIDYPVFDTFYEFPNLFEAPGR